MSTSVNQCCYCGLLCGSASEIRDCPKRLSVLARDSIRGSTSSANITDALVGLARTPETLVWVDAADVATMREVIRFAEASDATVHIGQTTGTKIQKRVAATEGWLGASLNEAANHADLVITFGDSLLSELQRIDQLLNRQTSDAKHWCHIGSQPLQPTDSNITLPRTDWYESLTSLLLAIREPKLHVDPSPAVGKLRDRLAACRYGVIVWHADEFLDELEELTLRRLSELARQVSVTSRLSLVCIESNPGRVTAQETMLWATGQSPSATFRGGEWIQRKDLDTYGLQDFQNGFKSVLMVRSVCTAAPLPNLACDVALLPGRELHLAPQSCTMAATVAAVGEQQPGLLFRGDHAAVLKYEAAEQSSNLSTIETLLSDAAKRLAEAKVEVTR